MATKKKVKKKVAVKKKTQVKKKAKARAKVVTVNVNVNVTPVKPKVRKNYLMMVLDESGSMVTIKPQALSAFNEQVSTVKGSKGDLDVSVSLVKFSDQVTTVFNNVNIDKVETLTGAQYEPHGFTAMYDGVGKAFEILNAQPDINDPDVTVLVLVISDGLENASKFYTSEKVANLVKEAQATGRWTFTYAGANQDLSQIAAKLNIPLGNTTSFQASAGGMSANNSLRSLSTKGLYTSYSAGQTSLNNFYNQTPQTPDPVDPTVDNSTSK